MWELHLTGRVVFLAVALFFPVPGSAFAQNQPSAAAGDAEYRGELNDLAGRILKRAAKAKCRPNQCTILVANFVGPEDSTSRLGIQLADSLSAELRSQANGVQIVDRGRLQNFLVREHIPSKLLSNREAARWLADHFQANTVLMGTLEQLGGRWNLLAELLNVSQEGIGLQEATWLTIRDPESSLAPFEPHDSERLSPAVSSAGGSAPTRAGVNGVGVPLCLDCPPPLYTDEGRKAKINGTVVLQVTVTEDGRAADIRVLKGMPLGMNELAVKSVSGWKFKPAMGADGKPASVIVPIEVSFRLY